MKRICLLSCTVALAIFVAQGCQPSNQNVKAPAGNNQAHDHDHDHEHQHAESLQELFQQLTDEYSKIKSAFEKNDGDASHEPLHHIAHLLDLDDGDFPALLKKSNLDEEAKGKVQVAVTKLFDEFGKLDAFFHGGPKVEWADLDKNIAPLFEELKGLIK